MSVGAGALAANTPAIPANPNLSKSPQNPKNQEELTTVTVQCKEQHQHDRSCPHTVSTQPAPSIGENGYLLDKRV